MQTLLSQFAFCTLLLPLLSGLTIGLFFRQERAAMQMAIAAMLLSFICALGAAILFFAYGVTAESYVLFQWLELADFNCEMGIWLDGLSVVMMLMIATVSLLVHIYSAAYMEDDTGLIRFFSLISLFTFAMLQLVMTNNMVGLFFGWEGVSLFSYLLIGFYYAKDTAAHANIKAFLMNRFGDLAFSLGIVLIILHVGSPQYQDVFSRLPGLADVTVELYGFGTQSVSVLVGFLFFIGAMTKSAQMPLHMWLPDSMEAPTPVSALIHAATMVTAGVFLLCRFSALMVSSAFLMNCIAFIGASGALWLGVLALCENDIKRIIAYSTLSQLGYMVLAVGVGAFQLAIFHLLLHALYKALLFLAAGSVIHALAHEQDIRRMGGLGRLMPITTGCFLVGALSLSGIPPFSGFYSKDLILLAVAKQSVHLGLGGYIYGCALAGFFVTPLYIFRAYWVVFFGQPRYVTRMPVYESPLAMTGPLAALAFLSFAVGFIVLVFFAGQQSRLFYEFSQVSAPLVPVQSAIQYVVEHGVVGHAIFSLGLYLALLGIAASWLYFTYRASYQGAFVMAPKWLNWVLLNGYGFNWVLEKIVVPMYSLVTYGCNRFGEQVLIHGVYEKCIALGVRSFSFAASRFQPSYLNRYFAIMGMAVVMMILISSFGSAV
jgi:NADH-quinone oxidoreductase subunit L